MKSHRTVVICTMALVGLCVVSDSRSQTQFLIPDRTNDVIYRVRDMNNDGLISGPGEVFLWFDGANAAGTLGMMNPSSQAVSVCRVAIIGDQVNRNVYRLVDANNDGDAQDLGESIVFADATNAYKRALELTTNTVEQTYIRRRLQELTP